VPAGQGKIFWAPVLGIYVFKGAGRQDFAPENWENVPVAHGKQTVEPMFALYVPGGHNEHDCWFGIVPYFPAGQLVHSAGLPSSQV
jgi:hypothetical protein